MKFLLVLLAFLTKNTCLEQKFIKKIEVFVNDCNSEKKIITFEKVHYECSEDF